MARATRLNLLGASLLAIFVAGCHQAPDSSAIDQAKAALDADRPADAITLLKPYVAAHVEDGPARAVLAEALLDLGNLQEARLQLAEADRLRAPRSQLRVSECRIATLTQELEQALMGCSSAMAESPTERAALHLHAGDAQRAAGHPLAAIAEYDQALKDNPRWEPAERGRAIALALAGDDATADRIIESLIANSLDKAGAWHLRGEIEFMRGNYPTAARAFTTAVELAGKAAQSDLRLRAGEHLVQSYLLGQDGKEALQAANSLLDQYPRAVVTDFLKAQALGAQGQLLEARAALEELLRGNPEQVQSKLLLGILLLGLGQSGQAEMFLHNAQVVIPSNGLLQAAIRAMEQNPGQPEKAFTQVRPMVFGAEQDARWLAWGGLLRPRAALVADSIAADPLRVEIAARMQRGGVREAVQYLEAEIARRATPVNLSRYAELVHRSRLDDAISALKRALQMDADNVDALGTYGEVLVQSGRPQDAIPVLERAVKLSPEAPRLHYWLALAYSSTSNRAAARDALGEALRGGQLFDERRAAEALAEELGLR